MPSDINLWITAVIAVAAMVALALWLGRDVMLKFNGVRFKTDRPQPTTSSDVRVAERAKVGGNVGSVVGRSVQEGEAAAGTTEVGKQMKIGGNVDQIVGVETTRKQPPP
jgi:hypothetical protein